MDSKEVFRVVVAHAVLTQRQHISVDLEKTGFFCVVGATSSGTDCIDLIQRHEPDLVISDVVLTDMDGLSVLRWLRTNRPNVRSLILSNYGGAVTSQVAALGADYCLLAPYTSQAITEWAALLLTPPRETAVPFMVQEIDRETRRILYELSATPKNRGFYDTMTGVRLLLQDPDQIHYVTGQLYPAIGAYRNANWQAVEHALRTLVKNIWTHSRLEVLERYFGAYLDRNATRPTSSVFLSMLAERVTESLRIAAEEKRQQRGRLTDRSS